MSTSPENDKASSAATDAKPEAVAAPPQATFPDGGWQAWSIVVGSFLIQMCGFGYTSSFGVYQDFYVRHYIRNASPSAISWIGSLNAFLVISGGVIAGRMYDRGYFYSLIWGGSLLTAFCLFMLSLAKPDKYYQVFLAQGLGMGLGSGMTYVPSVAILSQYFQKKRALTMMIVSAGASVGSIIHPIMLNNTLETDLGFGNAVRASAGLVTGLLLVACLLLRTRVPVEKKPSPSRDVVARSVRDGPYVAATFGLMIFSAGFYFPQFYLQLDATKHGLSTSFSFYALVILNACSAIGRVAPSLLLQKVSVQTMITITTLCGAALIFGMIGLGSVASVVLIAIFYGFFAGSFVGLMGPLMVSLTSNLAELGARMGIAFFFSGIGGLIGTPISGALLSEEFVWWKPALFSGLAALVGSISFGLMLVLSNRKKAAAARTSEVTTEKQA